MGLGNLALTGRLDRLTLAIGEERFGAVLIETLRALGEVDQVMAFAVTPRRGGRCLVSIGGFDSDEAEIAVETLLADPSLFDAPLGAVAAGGQDDRAHWFGLEAASDWIERLRDDVFHACRLGDLLGFVVHQDNVAYVVLLMRGEGRRFGTPQRWLLAQVGEIVAAHIRKHFCYSHVMEGQNQFVIARVLVEAPLFNAITPRERLVCVGILTGHTSESIAGNLQISINSVLTYRKRLYEKLGISSQNELFVRVIDALMALSAGQAADGKAPAGFLESEASRARLNGRPLGADLAFARAFFG